MGGVDDADRASGVSGDAEGEGAGLGDGTKEKKVALGWPRHAAHRSAVVLAVGFVGADQSGFPERRATCHTMGR